MKPFKSICILLLNCFIRKLYKITTRIKVFKYQNTFRKTYKQYEQNHNRG